MKTRLILTLIISTLFLIGCRNGAKYTQSHTIPKEIWKYDNPLIYSFDVDSNESLHDLFLSLTYGNDFGFQNIYVKIITEYPTLQPSEDIVSLNLTDGSGTFLGDCGGSSCTIDILLQEKFRFKEIGRHTIKIYQHSREEELHGVSSAELNLYEEENDK